MQWSEAAVSAIFKRRSLGDENDFDNYRGIAVGNLLGKLYSMIIDARLSQWSEKLNLRAEGQAGFRKGYRTTDQLFLLRHVLTQYKLAASKVYCCFVDFRKAYDSIRRDFLLQRLAKIGVGGNMLRAIACMYSSVPMCARVHGQLSDGFQSMQGVKQGDPLSPLLFGLFIDGGEQHIRSEVPGSGVRIGDMRHGKLCPMLFYADDIVLLATSAEQLKLQLQALEEFCGVHGMQVNVQKTKVLVTGEGDPRRFAASV